MLSCRDKEVNLDRKRAKANEQLYRGLGMASPRCRGICLRPGLLTCSQLSADLQKEMTR